MNGSHLSNGHGPQPERPRILSHNQGRRLRIPTVQEALPYTPFASIVPFNPNLIPPPLAEASTVPKVFSSSEEVKNVQQELERLSNGAQNAESASKRCQRTLIDVRRLLDAESLTQFKFAKIRKQRPASDTTRDASQSRTSGLSCFAKMVFDAAPISFRYVPTEPAEQDDTIRVQQKVTVSPSKTVQVQIPLQSLQSRHNEVPNRTSSHPQNSTPSVPIKIKPILVHPAATPAQRVEYQYIPDTDSFHASRDQHHKSDIALDNLKSLLNEILEAEDQVEIDPSDNTAMQESAYIHVHNADDGPVLMLQPEVQTRLDNAMHKIIATNRLDSVPIDQLVRIQRLCENAVARVRVGALEILPDWTDQDVADWLVHLAGAQDGLVAARTLMRIMIEGSHRKELVSEDAATTILNTLRGITDTCLVPVVQERSFIGEKIRGESQTAANPKFAIALANAKALRSLLSTTNKCLRVLGDLLAKNNVDDHALSSIEYLCTTLIFAENATSDKEAALGPQVFEVTRKCAMDVLSKVFTKYEGQRQFILQEILMSLEKLPATKQSARQFRLNDAKPIQLVSALLMRLVQTSATEADNALRLRSKLEQEGANQDESGGAESQSSEDDDAEYDDDDDDEIVDSPTKKMAQSTNRSQAGDLASVARPLYESASYAANYIVTMLLRRALATSKSSEEPFRKLLDIFTDDFLNVLGSSDWPSAEILLRSLVVQLIRIAENLKSSAPSRTLALELLGIIGCGVLDIESSMQDAAATVDDSDHIASCLATLARRTDDYEESDAAVTAFDGPYRVAIEHLRTRGQTDPQLQTASGYHLMQWAQLLCDDSRSSAHSSKENAVASLGLKDQVKNMMLDPQWLEQHRHFDVLTATHGRLAAKVLTSKLPLCKAFNRLFNVILTSMTSEQPTIRSRSLKSVTTLLDKHPAILDRNAQIISQIVRCMSDPSSLVRDSALALTEKCVSLRPALELQVYDRVISRTGDTAVGVRKRAMKFLKQVYLRHNLPEIRVAIAKAIMGRIQDIEPSVAGIARDIMEEIWFSAFAKIKAGDERSVDAVLHFRAQAVLIIEIVEDDEHSRGIVPVMEALIRSALSRSKQATENVKVCKTLVDVLFDGIIDSSDLPGKPKQGAILRALTIFARTDSSLFLASQLERLEPYVNNLTSNDDLDVYRHAVVVLRYTMPRLSSGLGQEFLVALQSAFLRSLGKISKLEIAVVAPCLWEVAMALKDTTRLRTTVASALNNIHGMRSQDLSANPSLTSKACKLLTIAGQFGNACDFESQLEEIKATLPWFKGESVAELFVMETCPFTSPKQPLIVREAALDAVCCICQRYPEQFLRTDVMNAVETVFKDGISSLEYILLVKLESFFAAQETQPHEDETAQLSASISTGSQRLDGTYKATEHETASTSLSQRFLPQLLRLALGSLDDIAESASRIVVSINRQGRTHPRDSGPALVALETCPKSEVAKMAFVEHKNKASKHESVYEKELIRGVQQAFEYQRKVVGSTTGFTGTPATSKLSLFWEVLKNGKAKVRTKFFTNLCTKLDFDPTKLDVASAVSVQLSFARFCLQAVAFLEYDRTEELLHLLSCLEKTFAGTGTLVAQAIETEVLQIQVPIVSSSQTAAIGTAQTENIVSAVDPLRLRQLAISSQILTLLWETRSFLVKTWNMHKHVGKPKNAAKDNIRAPTRASNAQTLTETYHNRVSGIMDGAATGEAQRAICAAFVDLISVDNEVKVGSEVEDAADMEDGHETRSEGSLRESSSTPGATPRGRKRKSIGLGATTSRKKGRARKSSTPGGMDEDGEDDEGEIKWA